MVSSKLRLIFALSLSFLITSCDNQEIGEQNTLEAVAFEDEVAKTALADAVLRAKALIKHYFGNQSKVTAYAEGPAGILVLNVLNTQTQASEFVFMLPDQKHLISGTLFSPYSNSVIEQLQQKANISANETKIARDEQREQTFNQLKLDLNSDQPVNVHAHMNKLNQINTQIDTTNDLATNNLITTTPNQQSTNQRLSTTQSSEPVQVVQTNPAEARPTFIKPELPSSVRIFDTQAFYDKSQNSTWIQIGASKKILYMYHDFYCPACKKALKLLQPYVDSNQISIRFIPVPMLGKKSSQAAVLSIAPETNDDKLKVFNELMQGASPEQLFIKSGLNELKINALQSKVKQHLRTLMTSKQPATPTFTFMTNTGPKVSLLSPAKIKTVMDTIIENP